MNLWTQRYEVTGSTAIPHFGRELQSRCSRGTSPIGSRLHAKGADQEWVIFSKAGEVRCHPDIVLASRMSPRRRYVRCMTDRPPCGCRCIE